MLTDNAGPQQNELTSIIRPLRPGVHGLVLGDETNILLLAHRSDDHCRASNCIYEV